MLSLWLIVRGLFSLDELRVPIALIVEADVCTDLIYRGGRFLDSIGLHRLPYRLNVGRFTRHSEVNLILKRSLSRANISSILKPSGSSKCNQSVPLVQDRCLVLSGMSQLTIPLLVTTLDAAVKVRSTASATERNRILKYRDL